MGSCERRIAREELGLDFDCSVSDKARQKERRMADFSPPSHKDCGSNTSLD